MKDTSQVHIDKYFQLILRRKYLFILVSLLCISIIVWGSFFMPKIYEAKSTVFIERNVIGKLIGGISITPSIEDRLRVLTYAMMSRSMILKVINSLDLDTQVKRPAEIESMVINFQRNTSINVRGEDLFIVTYRDKNPKLARDFVNALVSEYVEENTSSKRQEAFGANRFLSEQLNYYKKKVDESEGKVMNFRREKGIYFAADERTLITSIKEVKTQIENADMEIKKLIAKKEKVQKQLSGEEPLTLAIVDSENRGSGSLSARLTMLEQRLPMLLTQYTENYPEVIKIRAEIETISKQMREQGSNQNLQKTNDGSIGIGTSMMNPVYQKLKDELFSADSAIESFKAQTTELKKRMTQLEVELKDIPEENKALSDLARERDIYLGVHEQLLSRMGQVEISEQMEIQDKGSTFKVVDAAILPMKPVSPDRVKIILLSIIAGIAAGVGAVLLREYLDHSVRDIDLLKSELNIPMIAIIPKIITEQDIKRQKRFDRRVYAVSLAYVSIIVGLFIKEAINKFL